MSLRHYHASALDCDQCRDSYIDAVEVRDDLLPRFAQRDGWTQTEQGEDFCPLCSAKCQPQPAIETCSRSLIPDVNRATRG
jgi:hypothetical protein